MLKKEYKDDAEDKFISARGGRKNLLPICVIGEIDDLSVMLVCAVRYALGRRTYIVQWVCEFVRNNTNLLTERSKMAIIRDIEQQKDYGYGDECDKECWLALLDYLRKVK